MTESQAVKITVRVLNNSADTHFAQAHKYERDDDPKERAKSTAERTLGQYERSTAGHLNTLEV